MKCMGLVWGPFCSKCINPFGLVDGGTNMPQSAPSDEPLNALDQCKMDVTGRHAVYGQITEISHLAETWECIKMQAGALDAEGMTLEQTAMVLGLDSSDPEVIKRFERSANGDGLITAVEFDSALAGYYYSR
jgi:hypothetical protein